MESRGVWDQKRFVRKGKKEVTGITMGGRVNLYRKKSGGKRDFSYWADGGNSPIR